MNMSIHSTDQFVDEIYEMSHAAFSDRVVHQAKRCLLDYLGATFAGSQMLKEKGEKVSSFLGNGQDAALIGFCRRATLESAVFVNGLSSHVAELDDGVRFGMIHPGAPVFSALLPVAEKEEASGMDLLRGAIVGYEAEVRLASAMQPSHYARGYHPTSTCGTIGAAMGIAAMLGFTKEEMKDALSSAAVSAAGFLKVIEDGSEIKPLNVARAAVDALLAASVAKAGFKGLDDVLFGSTGFFAMMTDEYDATKLGRDSSEPFAIEKGYVKPYAACRHAHPSIEAALHIREKAGVTAGQVKEVRVFTYRAVLGRHDHREIQGEPSAKMSIPYGFAVALITGQAGIDQFNSAHINNAEILSLAGKVVVFDDDELSALVPQQRVAIIEVFTYSGECYSKRVDYPKGEPENPLSDDELEGKFLSLARYANRAENDIHKMVGVVWASENELQTLFPLL